MGQGPGSRESGRGPTPKGDRGSRKKWAVYRLRLQMSISILPSYILLFFTPFFIYFITNFIREKSVYLYTSWFKPPILLPFLRLQIGYSEVYRYTGLRTASKELTHHESVNCHPRRTGQPQIVTNFGKVYRRSAKSVYQNKQLYPEVRQY